MKLCWSGRSHFGCMARISCSTIPLSGNNRAPLNGTCFIGTFLGVLGVGPIRTRYFGHVTGYQPIRKQYWMHDDSLCSCLEGIHRDLPLDKPWSKSRGLQELQTWPLKYWLLPSLRNQLVPLLVGAGLLSLCGPAESLGWVQSHSAGWSGKRGKGGTIGQFSTPFIRSYRWYGKY